MKTFKEYLNEQNRLKSENEDCTTLKDLESVINKINDNVDERK